MSSIRVKGMEVSKGDLDILDEFMLSLGFKFYPGYDNKDEPSNMPWSTRYYRPDTATLTDGQKTSLHQTVDDAQFWHQNTVIKSE